MNVRSIATNAKRRINHRTGRQHHHDNADCIVMMMLLALSYTGNHDSLINKSHPANLAVAVPRLNRQQYPQLEILMCFRIFQDAPFHRFDLHE